MSSTNANIIDDSPVLFQEEAASNKIMEVASTYYPHVHFFEKTGKWGAWVRFAETKKRLYLGTHKTKHLAARCQDRANLKLKNKGAILNFNEGDYDEDKEMRENLSDEAFLKFLRAESRNCSKRMGKSLCLQKFVAQEVEASELDKSSTAQGKASKRQFQVASKKRTPLSDIVMDITHEVAGPTIVTSQVVTQMSNKVSKKLKDDTVCSLQNIPSRPKCILINMATRMSLAGRAGHASSSSRVLHTIPSRIQTPKLRIPERRTSTYYEAFQRKGSYNLHVLADVIAMEMDAQIARSG